VDVGDSTGVRSGVGQEAPRPVATRAYGEGGVRDLEELGQAALSHILTGKLFPMTERAGGKVGK